MAYTIDNTGADFSILVSPVFERGLRSTVSFMLKAIEYYERNRETLQRCVSPDVITALDQLLIIKPVLLQLAALLREKSS